MAIIYSYPTVVPKLVDKLIITQTYDSDDEAPVEGNPTRSATISDILALANPGGYGSLKTAGNIALTNELTDIQDGTSQNSGIKINNLGDLEVNEIVATGEVSQIGGVLNVGDATGWDPQPQAHRVRVKGQTSPTDSNPGFIVINTEENDTIGALLAWNDKVEFGSRTDDPVSIIVNKNEAVNLTEDKVFISDKNVGINVENPLHTVHIEPKSGNADLALQKGNGGAKATLTATNNSVTLDSNESLRLRTGGENRVSILADGTVFIASIGMALDKPLLKVNGSIQIGNSHQHSPPLASLDNVGSMRYNAGPLKSVLEMSMQTATNPNAYEWVTIKVNIF